MRKAEIEASFENDRVFLSHDKLWMLPSVTTRCVGHNRSDSCHGRIASKSRFGADNHVFTSRRGRVSNTQLACGFRLPMSSLPSGRRLPAVGAG